jgi:hypothetical protein
MSEWHPEGVGRAGGRRKRPNVGDTVAYDRRAWEVRHVADADPTDDELERLSHYVQHARDQMLPYRISLRRLYGEKHDRENSVGDVGLRVPVRRYGDPFHIYPNGRVPLCSCHSQPWPCLEADQQEQAAKELREAERELRLLPGCCPGCQEPVTSRQKSITFGGPNVRNPLAEGPTFHLRSKCHGAAARYEEAWVNAEPGRARSLLTLACRGTVIVHHDGTAECFGADDSDCPSVYARHRCYSACYLQSHGCGRDCPTAGHPGTRVAGRPNDPRAITRTATP